MRPIPFRELILRMFTELESSGTIFSFHEDQFYRKEDERTLSIFSQTCASPIGPAAGPHTQLAQNIIVSYLAGGRFMELKTVQKLDTLEIGKPCIDARDEGYNVEWSSEFTLEKSFDEYLKAWFALHLLESWMDMPQGDAPSFIFNMSVGYDLEGIRTEKMQHFIDSMIDASSHELFGRYSRDLNDLAAELGLKEVGRVSPCISPSVTLSTMHGCPPKEIEAICMYMLSEKNLDTFVKLNPTLLGYDRVRGILDSLGYDYLHLRRESFDHDLQYADAIEMLMRLSAKADSCGRSFGVKLSNTLGSVNDQGELPGDEMYMSGRALFPLTVTLAADLSEAFNGQLPFSYSGGANSENVSRLFDAGIRPITAATELLKPSGYLRMTDMAAACDEAEKGWSSSIVDVKALRTLAEDALVSGLYRKEYRGDGRITAGEKLPRYDCYIAPCVAACPIRQDVPEYLYLAGQGLFDEALELIYQKNPLPHIMGYICDHQCMYNCTRIDYEGAVQIRELKRISAEKGYEAYRASWIDQDASELKAAVIGAGPAGLSAAYFLALSGFNVTVFERESSAGGIVQHVIPDFRFPQEAIDADVSFIESLGVTFSFNADPDNLGVQDLKDRGFSYLIYAVGAEKGSELRLEKNTGKMTGSLAFLRSFRKKKAVSLGEHAVIVGGGNTAMDSARAAAAVPGVKTVTVVYRRTLKQMPADLEEYDNALKDGVVFTFLTNPVSLDGNTLTCRVMELGDPDESGRPMPVETSETFTLPCDTLITAVGETVNSEMLSAYGIPVNERGWADTDPETLETKLKHVYLIGDAQSGPSTVVRSAAAARKAYEHILDTVLGPEKEDEQEEEEFSKEDIEDMRDAELSFFSELRAKKRGRKPQLQRGDMEDEALAAYEASRCLECSYLCNKCVDVCPNRANAAVDVRVLEHFQDPYQIIHIDAFCNECGNCAVFCPWEGKPYTDKFTVFSLIDDFRNSANSGFFLDGEMLHIRDGEKELECRTNEISDADIGESNRLLILHIISSYKYLLTETGL